jgi:hypothetical protein
LSNEEIIYQLTKETKVKGKSIIINGLLLFLLFIVIIFAGCGDKELNSKWRTQNITIDGNDSDWSNSLVFYEDINSLVGVQNDNDCLYLCLVTTDQQFERKILVTGLTIWFDNEDKGDRKFGIRFPIRMKNMNNDAFQPGEDQAEGRRRDPDDGQEGLGDKGQPAGATDKGKMGDMFLKNQTEIEVIDANNEATRFPISELKGIELKMTVKDYRMVYEFKIPIAMKNAYSFAVGATTGSTISVGLETGNTETKKNKGVGDKTSGEGGGEPTSGEGIGNGNDYGGEGNGMRSGGRGHGHGGQGSGSSSSSNQPVKFWEDVKLNSGSN